MIKNEGDRRPSIFGQLQYREISDTEIEVSYTDRTFRHAGLVTKNGSTYALIRAYMPESDNILRAAIKKSQELGLTEGGDVGIVGA